MKKNLYSTLILAALSAVSCEKVYDGPCNPKPKPEVEEEPAMTDITSIYSLNRKEGFVNSHHSDWKYSFIETDFRSTYRFVDPVLTAKLAYYPRIKQLANGGYMLSYQQNNSAHDVYYGLSYDFKNWDFKDRHLFEKVPFKEIDANCPLPETSKILYSSADYMVLADGDILAFAAYRFNPSYTQHTDWCGIMIRRSTDNGKTWSTPRRIFQGSACWEPSGLQLESGEIHIYYTRANPSIGDSGTALLRSTDNGETWEDVGYVIRQAAGTGTDGVTPIYTDQMPVAIRLNETGRIAIALESRFGRTATAEDKYHISMAWCDDNWASGGLTGSQVGPADRANNIFLNEAAPYLVQFPSGETVLSTGINKVHNIRMGNARADQFSSPYPVCAGPGVWGSIDVADSHVLLSAFNYRATDNADTYGIEIRRHILNHRINASEFTPAMTGSSTHWENVDDALFIGSEMYTQTVFRFAYDEENIYCLVERSDESLTAEDGMTLMFQSGNTTGSPLILEITSSPDKGTMLCNNSQVKFRPNVLGEYDGIADDEGVVIEIAIPKSLVNIVNDRLLFNAVVKDADGQDTFTGLDATNYNRWIPIVFKAAEQPKPLPVDGNYEGPSWEENDNALNPW
ncbi:MAG: glycoside hydrolase [Bacteroidales bacterium]|nr:glycoside hydrolase [Bacteroidales bacterium]